MAELARASRASSRGGEATSPPDVSTSLPELIATMTRFLSKLSEHSAVAGIGLAEWSVLGQLAQTEQLRPGHLAYRLGITPQRAAQLVTALSRSGYISVAPLDDDHRAKIASLTEKGREKVRTIDRNLQTLLETESGIKMTFVNRNIKKMMKAISPPKA